MNTDAPVSLKEALRYMVRRLDQAPGDLRGTTGSYLAAGLAAGRPLHGLALAAAGAALALGLPLLAWAVL